MNDTRRWLHRLRTRLARQPAAVGIDGFAALRSAGAELDKPWSDLLQEFTGAREAWRVNPLARRLINLVTSFVVGDGFTLSSDDPSLAAFLTAFWHDEQNSLALRQYGWCEELARSGELFVTLHLNSANGLSYVRTLPAASIDRIDYAPGDYERELVYHEIAALGDPDYPAGRAWRSPEHAEADLPLAGVTVDASRFAPVCLHFAINRPTGCLRGESDLASVLPWLRRYAGWLEDRTRLNAAVHAFLWIVGVPGKRIAARTAELSRPPAPGTVVVIDKDNETWDAVAPNLHAADAGADGRALRWMIAAGGPGVGLVDLGEADDANHATARAMGEQRSRFMRARQAYFAFVLAKVALTAYNRAVRLGAWPPQTPPYTSDGAGPTPARATPATLADIRVNVPDISPADNNELGAGAGQMADALAQLSALGLRGDRWRSLALRLILKFAGETIDDHELSAILAESAAGAAPGG